MSDRGPIISFIQPTSTFLAAGIADKRSLIQFRAMIAAGSEVITMGITVMAEFTHSFADRSIEPAKVHFLAFFEPCALVVRFIEMIMFQKGTVLFNLFGDCGWIFT